MQTRGAGTRVVVAVTAAVLFAGVLLAQDGKRRAAPAAWPGDRFDVLEKSIDDLQQAMAAGTITSRDLVEIYQARIRAYDKQGPALNAFISLNPNALDEAAALDRERATRGARGPLHGIPVAVKDNFDMAGTATTGGSIALATMMPVEDSSQVKRLREAGAVIIGKTNLHELAMGVTTVSSLGGQTRNPYDPRRNPGGSSGGTGAAVAANLVAAGLGSDTCGSIRIPASEGSLVGLRGTWGLTGRGGVLPLSHSQDVVGPITRTVADAAILLQVMAGPDPRDAATGANAGKVPASYRAALRADALSGARIGVLRSLFGDAGEDREAGDVVQAAIDQMKKLGAETFDVSVPGLDDLLRGSSVIDSEFRFDFEDYVLGMPNAPVHSAADILTSGMYGQAIESTLRRRSAVASRETEIYRRARIRREAVRQALLALFDEQRLDAIAYPTLRRKPALIGEPQAGSTCQLSASSGMPALAMPAGFTADRLPIGVELLGRPFDESRLLALAYAFEQKTHVRQPPLSAPALASGGVRPAAIPFFGEARLPTTEAPGRAPTLTMRFAFDAPAGDLRYEATVAGIRAGEVIGASVHRAGSGDTGAALYQVLRQGTLRQEGTITLTPVEHVALREGKLYVAWYTRRVPAGVRLQMRLPGS